MEPVRVRTGESRNLNFEPGRTTWTVLHDGRPWADFEFPLAGEYNVWNATAAAALAASVRHLERRDCDGAEDVQEREAAIGSEGASERHHHHRRLRASPTAIAGTLKALRARYAGARLWAVLEPRSNTLRRRVLQADLARSLALADEVIVAAVFRSEAVPEHERLELPELAADIQKHGSRARLLRDADEIVQTIAPELCSGDVVAILSNGGFGGIYDKLPARLRTLADESGQYQFGKCGGEVMRHRAAIRRATFFVCLLLLWMALAPAYATTNYTISLANPEQHLLEVQIILPEGSAQRELQLPVWNALYQVRDFSQYVNWVRVKDRAGHPLTVRELNKSLWQIAGAEGGAIVEYQIFVDSPGPFGAQFNSHHAFLNLAQVLMYPVDARHDPMIVRFNQVPQGWHIATPLASLPRAGSVRKPMTGWWILRSRLGILRNLISMKLADTIA